MSQTSQIILFSVFAPILLLAITPACADNLTSEEILKIERSLIESRTSINSGHVVLDVRTDTEKQISEPVVLHNNIYFSGDSIREDTSISSSKSPAETEPNQLKTSQLQFVITNNTAIRNLGPKAQIQLYGPNTKPKSFPEISDPRRLGVVIWYFSSIDQFGFESFFLRPDRTDLIGTTEVKDGHPIVKVTFTIKNTVRDPVFAEYWLATDMGNAPLYLSERAGEGENADFYALNCKEKDVGGGLWFPAEVTYQRSHGGKLQASEVCTVDEAEFGQRIDDSIFTLTGLGIEKGRTVYKDGKVLLWDGDQLVP